MFSLVLAYAVAEELVHVLPVSPWVFSGYYSFLSHWRHAASLMDEFKLPVQWVWVWILLFLWSMEWLMDGWTDGRISINVLLNIHKYKILNRIQSTKSVTFPSIDNTKKTGKGTRKRIKLVLFMVTVWGYFTNRVAPWRYRGRKKQNKPLSDQV